MKALRLRGVNFSGTLRALTQRFGSAVAERVLARVPGEAGVALRARHIGAEGWYPVDWYDALLASIEAELPREATVCRDVGRAAVTEDMSTIFSALSFVATPDFALVNATRVAATYIDGGKISVLAARPGLVHFRFDGFHGYTPRMWQDFAGGMEAVIDLMRLVRLSTEITLGDDTSRCEIVLRYQA